MVKLSNIYVNAINACNFTILKRYQQCINLDRIALLFDIKHPHKIYFKTIYNFSQPVVEMFFFF